METLLGVRLFWFPTDLGSSPFLSNKLFAAMNLKKIAIWKWNASDFASYIMIFAPFNDKTPVLVF